MGDFEEWIVAGLGSIPMPVRVVRAWDGESLPDAESCAGAVITGSHAMVTDNLPWSVAIERWINGMIEARVPLLGICYGHQLLGRAAGGKVGYNPNGREVGTVMVELTEEGLSDPLFAGVPGRFPAHATHAQSVLSLPPGAVRLARNGHEANHAMRVGECAWGLQFHPEHTVGVIRTYVEEQRKGLEGEGRDVDAIAGAIEETPGAARVLTNFASFLCRSL